MLFPKPVRQRNRKAIEKARKGYCEWCGRSGPVEVHHVTTRGAGGVDCERTNLVSLCYICHTKAHNLQITKKQLKDVIARRALWS